MDKYMKKSDVIAYIRKEAKDAQDMFEECGGEWGIVADAYKALADDFATSDDRVKTTLIGMDFSDGADYIVRETVAKHSADGAPVRPGRWIRYGADKRGRGGIFRCSACEKSYPYVCDYCPNCGAAMMEDAE